MRSISARSWARALRVGREEHEAGAVGARRRQGERHGLAEEPVRHLHEDAGAIAGVGVGPAGAAMFEVDEQLERLADYRVRADALDVRDETDAAGVVLVTGPV